ncbi:MAG: hypothetical protein N5P05_000297 [Chroococcopsis gigantea SAG 12.99]|jgi:serralysin|nr:hypothetical protein [Chroococcopsis gigantea SAG 12.99]
MSSSASPGKFDQTPIQSQDLSGSSPRGDAFGGGTATSSTTPTYDNNIDGLLIGTQWASASLSFSFTDSFSDYESGYPNSTNHSSSFQTLNNTQRAVGREWLTRNYYNVSLLSPYELTGGSDRDATVRIAMSNDPGTAYGYYPGGSVEAGDIWFNRNDYNAPVIGNYAYHTFGHEIGHALGLKHGHETGGIRNVSMNADRDSMEFSIMTYRSYVGHNLGALPYYTNETYGYAQSLMMYDIRAIQQMYGAWFGYNSANTTYTFSTTTGEMFVDGVAQGTPGANRIFRTIWDGNGTDTYDFANYSTNLSVDLSPGGWSNLDTGGNFQRAVLNNGYGGIYQYARGHVFNALQYNGDARSLIENAKGGAGNDVIVGNIANNSLWGNGGNDTIYGGAGNDTVDGGDGNDLIYLGDGDDYVNVVTSGNDTYYGGTGNDYIYGYTGDELYYGEDGNDTLLGSIGNDTINGGAGDDSMDGGSGIDTVDYTYWSGGGTYNLATGIASFPGFYDEEIQNFENIWTGAGNDYIIGSAGGNFITAGAGNDTVDGGDGNDLIYLGDGDDYLNIISLGNDTYYGGTGNDYIYGYTGDELYYGEDGNDTLLGSGGNDTINGGGGDDSMDGGSGIDTVDYTYWIGGGTYNLATGIASFPGFYDEEIQNFENIWTGAGNDYIIGSATDNVIVAGAGNDTVDGGDGNDLIYLGDGDDYLDIISSGNDTYYGGTGNDYIYGYTGNELYYGEDGNDTLLGSSGNDTINGGAGDDLMDGGTGNDNLMGGIGNDTYIVDSSGDVVTEVASAGIDTVKSSISYTLTSNVENLLLTGAGAINGTGNTLNNSITGNGANNVLNGGAGNDTLVGGAGNDTYIVDSLGDVVTEAASAGIDTVKSSISYTLTSNVENLLLTGAGAINGTGNTLNNSITGNGANNVLNGGAGNDNLVGGVGNDTLGGSLGTDTLTGGVGGINSDRFVFDTGAAFNAATIGVDVITDFTHGIDKIVLDKTTFTALTGSLTFAVVSSLTQAQTSSALFTYISSLGSLFYNQNRTSAGLGTGGQFADLTNSLVISSSDFLVQA